MLTPKETKGKGKRVTFRRKKQQRNPRRLLESVPNDWKRWDAAAAAQGLNWSEFTRRVLNEAAERELLFMGGGDGRECRCGHAPSSHYPDLGSQTRGVCLMPGCTCGGFVGPKR